MNPTLLLPTLSFLLFAFTTNLPLALSQQGHEKVLDSNGNPIIPGGRYYLKPAIAGEYGGGVTLGKTGNSTCSNTVLQDSSESANGVAMKFNIQEKNPSIIFSGTRLDIAFEEKPECVTSSKWVVVVDDFPEKWVGIGDATQDHPGKNITSGRFVIHKYNNMSYMLLFCPTSSSSSSTPPVFPVTCFNIARHDDEKGSRRLILSNGIPFQVMFVDAN